MTTPSTPEPNVFRILLAADFQGAGEESVEQPLVADKVGFDELVARFAPRLKIQVPGCMGEEPERWNVELEFRSMADFHGRAILERCSVTRPWYEACLALRRVAGGESSTADALQVITEAGLPVLVGERLRALLAQPAGDAPEPTVPETGDLLKSVEMPKGLAAGGEGAEGLVSALIERLGIPRQTIAQAPERRVAANALASLAERLQKQLDAVLHHPELQALEAAWRGCQLVVTRADLHQDVPPALYVSSCKREDLPGRLGRDLRTITEMEGCDGVDAVITGFVFDQTSEDVSLLSAAAAAAAREYAMLVVGGSRALIGVEGEDYSRRPESLRLRFDEPDLIEWRSLREQEPARSLTVVVPELLARHPYGAKTTPLAEIGYEEEGGALWASGSWALGVLMLESVARTGWPLSLTGPTDGVLEKLPVAPVSHAGRTVRAPAPALWTDEEHDELARAGFAVLSARSNQNRLWVQAVPTLAEPEPGADAAETREARQHASLPHRLFANRIARRLDRLLGQLGADVADAEVERILWAGLGELFGKPDVVRVEVSAPPDEPDARDALVQILPDFRILGREVDLILSVRLPG